MSSRYPAILSLAAVLIACSLSIPGRALARSHRDLPWSADQAWATAVRLLRVDLGFELVERDPDARFIMFRYTRGERQFPGSLEIVERRLDDGRSGVRVIIAVPAMPGYIEEDLIDRLERKLRDEVGPPMPAPVVQVHHRRSLFDRPGSRQDDEAASNEADEDATGEESDDSSESSSEH